MKIMRILPRAGALTFLAIAACSTGNEGPASSPTHEIGGYYVGPGIREKSLSVSQLATGNWVVETAGTAPETAPANACHIVAVGSKTGAQLIASTDLNLDFTGRLTDENHNDYGYLVIEFDGDFASVSGPAAENAPFCDLRGTYELQSASPRHEVF